MHEHKKRKERKVLQISYKLTIKQMSVMHLGLPKCNGACDSSKVCYSICLTYHDEALIKNTVTKTNSGTYWGN